jgi:hypothetical protein
LPGDKNCIDIAAARFCFAAVFFAGSSACCQETRQFARLLKKIFLL